MRLRTLLHRYMSAGAQAGITSEIVGQLEQGSPDTPEGQISIIASTNSRELQLIIESIASTEHWMLSLTESWSQTLRAVERRTTGVVLLDADQLGADWRDVLQILLRPAHRCCVILITSGEHHLFCEEFMQDGGFGTLSTPVVEPQLVVEVVRAAWEFWKTCVRQPYGY